MKKPIMLPKARAREIILHAAGLSRNGQFGRGPEAVYKVIDQLGFIQVDTNYVVERAHHHALATRVPGYQTAWLEELQQEGRIYEFWTRDSGFMPMAEFRYSIPIHDNYVAKYAALPQPELHLMQKILDRIGREGPLGAKDFDNARVEKSSGWWDWRPSKVALERLHMSGQLLTTRKKDFHKLYDLTTNIVPAHTDKTKPSMPEFSRHIILRTLKSLGIAYAKEMAWNARLAKHTIKEELKGMVDRGLVCEVTVEGLKSPLYMLPEYRHKKIRLAGDAFVLSPFDPLNVFRHRLREFFNFDYQIECFVPAAKREYGYFCLPLLVGDVFVGRMDAAADRKNKALIIQNLHVEAVELRDADLAKLAVGIQEFAEFNHCYRVDIIKSNKKQTVKLFQKILSCKD